VPEPVTGYAEVRWPKMEAARARASQTLAALRKSSAFSAKATA